MDFNLVEFQQSAYPAVAVETVEEEWLIDYLVRAFPEHNVHSVTATEAFLTWRLDKKIDSVVVQGAETNATYAQALERLKQDGVILVIHDYQWIISNPGGYRKIKETFPHIKRLKPKGSMMVLVAPHWSIPDTLKHELPVLQMPLPTRTELAQILPGLGLTGLSESLSEKVLDASAGLTRSQAENAFAIASTGGSIDPGRVEVEKVRLIKQDSRITISPPIPWNQVGGLGKLKAFIERRVVPVRHDPQLMIRGLLLAGISGTGKSRITQAVSSLLEWPCLSVAIGSLKAGIVGQSEGNMRQVLRTAEAHAPCILRLDEVEKGVGGYAGSGQTDGGTTLGMVGILLEWLSSHKSTILTVATCNNYKMLPPEMTAAHRFDECFFVDTPKSLERPEHARIHLKAYGCDESLCSVVASRTDGWTGAEIAKLIKFACIDSNRNVTDDTIMSVSDEIKTYAERHADDVAKLREWGLKTMRIANTEEEDFIDKSATRQIKRKPAKELVN